MENANNFDEDELRRTLDGIFTKYDENKDENLSREEVKNMLKEMAGRKKGKKGGMTDEEINNNI